MSHDDDSIKDTLTFPPRNRDIRQNLHQKLIQVYLKHQETFQMSDPFGDNSFHPSQCISWLMGHLDFGAMGYDSSNSYCLDQALSAERNYLSQCREHDGLAYDEHGEALRRRLTAIEEARGLTHDDLDWKAVRRVLEGSYDLEISQGKNPLLVD